MVLGFDGGHPHAARRRILDAFPTGRERRAIRTRGLEVPGSLVTAPQLVVAPTFGRRNDVFIVIDEAGVVVLRAVVVGHRVIVLVVAEVVRVDAQSRGQRRLVGELGVAVKLK